MQKCQESIREAKEARAAEVLEGACFIADDSNRLKIRTATFLQPGRLEG